MVKKISIFLLLFILSNLGTLSALPPTREEKNQTSVHPSGNPWMTREVEKSIEKYLLPDDHPAKDALDHIFQASRATLNENAFREAGFKILFSQPRSFIKVAAHPLLPGYLVKVQYDDELRLKQHTPFWKWLSRRCEGAKKLRDVIKKKKIKHFIAAKKWIYTLPSSPGVPDSPGYLPKPIILLVEDMNIVSYEESLEAWKTQITQDHLNELYMIMLAAGGSSYRPDNIVMTKNGLFAFIDTEYPNRTPDMHVIANYLSPEMQAYWLSLFNM